MKKCEINNCLVINLAWIKNFLATRHITLQSLFELCDHQSKTKFLYNLTIWYCAAYRRFLLLLLCKSRSPVCSKQGVNQRQAPQCMRCVYGPLCESVLSSPLLHLPVYETCLKLSNVKGVKKNSVPWNG